MRPRPHVRPRANAVIAILAAPLRCHTGLEKSGFVCSTCAGDDGDDDDGMLFVFFGWEEKNFCPAET